MKIVCDDKIPFLKGALEPYAEILYLPGAAIDAAAVHDADALIIRTRTRCDASLLKHSRVRIVVTATIGYDHIDTAWCASHNVQWYNCAGCNAASVEQYIASVLVALSRHYSFDFEEKVLGVVGVGHVGGRVADMAKSLGFRLLLNDPPRARREGKEGFVSLDELTERSDIITLHTPLNLEGDDATFHLFDKERLSRLRPQQILINTSRGEVTDNIALRTSLLQRQLLTAVLDVWENEPFIDTRLIPLLFAATPHIAGYSQDGKAAGTVQSVQAIGRYFGWPCARWRVASIPLPAQATTFTLNAAGLTWRELVSHAVEHTYRVQEDSLRLQADPAAFEQQRGNYPVRREFTAYTLHVENSPAEWTKRMKKMGFKEGID